MPAAVQAAPESSLSRTEAPLLPCRAAQRLEARFASRKLHFFASSSKEFLTSELNSTE